MVGLNLFFNRETREGGIPAMEQEYLHDTFKYVGAGVGITALAARGLHVAGWSSRLMALNPWVALGGGLVLSIGNPYSRETNSRIHDWLSKYESRE
jgi:growth hormone-inducible transmembrane protein